MGFASLRCDDAFGENAEILEFFEEILDLSKRRKSRFFGIYKNPFGI